jgi:hypothetical protein
MNNKSLENSIIALRNAKEFYAQGGKCKVPENICPRFSEDSTCENCYLGERNVNMLLERIEKNRGAIELHMLIMGQSNE